MLNKLKKKLTENESPEDSKQDSPLLKQITRLGVRLATKYKSVDTDKERLDINTSLVLLSLATQASERDGRRLYNRARAISG